MITTQTILDTTTYGQAAGNYDGSSQDWSSPAVTAADYYHGRGSIQTLTFSVQNFEGIIYVEATLDDTANSTAWFTTYVYGDGSTVPLTDYHPAAIAGNFTWIRLRVEGFSGGVINSVTITY